VNQFANTGKTYVFKNIRFAAPPLGKLRWAKPAAPLKQDGIQDGSDGKICTQAKMGNGPPRTTSPSGEDCLFLDLTVPGEAIRTPGLKLPVVNWIYGGAYGKLISEVSLLRAFKTDL
jgi:carboxylesterase type B